jgi:hypothetical protein
VSQESGPDIVENEFGEPLRGTTQPIFQQRLTAANAADARDSAESADVREAGASVKDILDTVAGAVSATDPQSFLLGLIGALGRTVRAPTDGDSSLVTMLRHLGDALDEELDEEHAFQNLVAALERKRFGMRALDEAAPVVAAFLARIVSAPILRTVSGAPPAHIAALVDGATRIARDALESNGARGWRALPDIASTIARRAAQRDLSVAALAKVLPQLSARLASGPRESSTSKSDHFRARAHGEPRRMVLTGPVEIVILER